MYYIIVKQDNCQLRNVIGKINIILRRNANTEVNSYKLKMFQVVEIQNF